MLKRLGFPGRFFIYMMPDISIRWCFMNGAALKTLIFGVVQQTQIGYILVCMRPH